MKYYFFIWAQFHKAVRQAIASWHSLLSRKWVEHQLWQCELNGILGGNQSLLSNFLFVSVLSKLLRLQAWWNWALLTSCPELILGRIEILAGSQTQVGDFTVGQLYIVSSNWIFIPQCVQTIYYKKLCANFDLECYILNCVKRFFSHIDYGLV